MDKMVWLAFSWRADTTEPARNAALIRFAHVLQQGVGPHLSAQAYVWSGIDFVAGTAHGRALANGPAPFNAIVELTGEDENLLEKVKALCPALRPQISMLVDAERSGIIAGTAHTFLAGDAPFLSAYCHRPAKGKTIEACQAHWKAKHLEIVSSVIKSEPEAKRRALASYVQFHSDATESRLIADALGVRHADFTGVARNLTSDPQDMTARFKSSATENNALADELNFIDHDRSFIALYRRLSS